MHWAGFKCFCGFHEQAANIRCVLKMVIFWPNCRDYTMSRIVMLKQLSYVKFSCWNHLKKKHFVVVLFFFTFQREKLSTFKHLTVIGIALSIDPFPRESDFIQLRHMVRNFNLFSFQMIYLMPS